MEVHRKCIRHFHEPGHCHELTFSCYDRQPLLASDERRRMLSQTIDSALCASEFRLVAFVYMPEHVHLLVFPAQPGSAAVSRFLKAIKRPFSFWMKGIISSTNRALLETLTVTNHRGETTFRFWQAGPGYDRNLTSPATVCASIDYIHLNPVRRQLCARACDWKWSSYNYYQDPEQSPDPDLPKIHFLPADYLL